MAGKKMKKIRNDRLTIPEYFENQSVFVTGATGFMGKVLLEKLLRSCPGVKTIYILMRPKKGIPIEERLKTMFTLPMFIKIKRECPEFFAKVVPLEGDCAELGLGLKPEDTQLLKDEVSIVFHAAASVRFDDQLKAAVLLNLRGTLETVKLALEMKKITSFVHVSTSYCIKHRPRIDEKIYPAPAEWDQVIRLAETLDNDILDFLTPKILDEYPNTYTFTKALAEHVISDYSDRLPTCIYRPSIVICTLSEPIPGWVDNFNGPVGLIVASGKGIVRTVYSDPNIKSDFVPCDIAVKAMIATAWNRATSLEPFDEQPPVYNASNNNIRSITQRELVEIGHQAVEVAPLNHCVWLPGGNVTKCRTYYYLKLFFLQLIPAFIIDFILKMYNKPPLLAKIQRRIFVATSALEYFVTREWHITNKKLLDLNFALLEEDKAAFSYFNPDVDLLQYFVSCIYTCREHLLKEDNCEMDQARKHYNRMYWLDKVTKLLFLLSIAYVSFKFGIVQFLSFLIRSTIAYFLSVLDFQE